MALVLAVTVRELSLVKHFLACLSASMRGMWDHLAPANSGGTRGILSLQFGLCGLLLPGKERTRCLPAVQAGAGRVHAGVRHSGVLL